VNWINGLLRQFMPKGADLSKASQEYLNNVADPMNAVRGGRSAGRHRIRRWKRDSQSSIQVLRLQVETAHFRAFIGYLQSFVNEP